MLSYVHDRIFCQDNQAAQPGMHLLQAPVAAPPDDTQAKYASAQQPDAPQQSKIYGTLRPLPCSLRDSATPCLQCHCSCSACCTHGPHSRSTCHPGTRSTERQQPGGGHPVPAHRRQRDLCAHRRHAVRAERQTLLPWRHKLVWHRHPSSCNCVCDVTPMPEGLPEERAWEHTHTPTLLARHSCGTLHPTPTPSCYVGGMMTAFMVRACNICLCLMCGR